MPLVSVANGITNNPKTKAIAVMATGTPRLAPPGSFSGRRLVRNQLPGAPEAIRWVPPLRLVSPRSDSVVDRGLLESGRSKNGPNGVLQRPEPLRYREARIGCTPMCRLAASGACIPERLILGRVQPVQ